MENGNDDQLGDNRLCCENGCEGSTSGDCDEDCGSDVEEIAFVRAEHLTISGFFKDKSVHRRKLRGSERGHLIGLAAMMQPPLRHSIGMTSIKPSVGLKPADLI